METEFLIRMTSALIHLALKNTKDVLIQMAMVFLIISTIAPKQLALKRTTDVLTQIPTGMDYLIKKTIARVLLDL